jgi:hypothetical protein
VEDGVERSSGVMSFNEKVFKREPVCHLSEDKLDTRREQIAPTVAEVVKNGRLVSLFGKK